MRSPRPLRLDFRTPVSGRVELLLVLWPRGNLFSPEAPAAGSRQATVTLPLPRPHGEPVRDGGFVAYRLAGLEAQLVQPLRVVGVEPRDFPAFFWQAAGMGTGTVSYAGQVRAKASRGLCCASASAPSRPAARPPRR